MVHQSILGTEAFVARVEKKLPQKGQREMPALKRLQRHISVENIIGQVAKAGNAAGEDLRDRKLRTKFLGKWPWNSATVAVTQSKKKSVTYLVSITAPSARAGPV